MTEDEYYTAPSDEVFRSIKANCIKIWRTYDDTYGYATSKINRIKNIKNIRDNTAYMVSMFDATNQMRLLNKVKGSTRIWLHSLLVMGRVV